MHLERLHMEAFGPYLETQVIDFSPARNAGLFLVQGPTGSGKSTILDAICFCLFDSVSGDKREHQDMRCHLAPENMKTRVILEFVLQDRRYRAERSFGPRKGQGDSHQCLMEEETAPGAWKPLYNRLSEAPDVVQSLLGLKAEQFRQVILLPQGRFRDFLTSPAAARTEILKALFHTDRLEDFTDRLKDRVRQLKEELEDRLRRRSDMLATLSIADLQEGDALLEDLSRRQTGALSLRDRCREDRGRASDAREKARIQESLREEESRLLEESRELESCRGDMETLETRISRAIRVQPVIQEGGLLKERRQELSRMEEDLAKLEVLMAERADREAAHAGRGESLRQARETLVSRRDRLVLLDRLRELLARNDGMNARESDARTRLETLEKEASLLTGELSLLAGGKDTLGGKELRDLQDRMADLLPDLQEAREAERVLTDQEALVGVQEREQDKLSANREVLAKEIRDLENRKQILEPQWNARKNQEHLAMARMLREGLRPGDPCPVCGSSHHPLSGTGISTHALSGSQVPPDGKDGTDPEEEWQELERQLLILHTRRSVAESDLAGMEETLKERQQNLLARRKVHSDRISRLLALWPGLPAGSAPGVPSFPPGLEGLVQHREWIDRSCRDVREKEAESERKIRDTESALARVHGQQEAGNASLSALAREREAARPALEGTLRDAGLEGTPSTAEVAALREELARTVEADTRALDSHEREGLVLATEAREQIQSLQMRTVQRDTAREEFRQRDDAFNDRVKSMGFKDVEEARLAWMKEDDLARAKAQWEEWKNRLALSGSRLEQLAGRIDREWILDSATAQGKLEEAEAALEQAVQEAVRCEGALETARHSLAKAREITAGMAASESRFSLAEGLLRCLSGGDSKSGITIERYALSVYLDEVLEEANRHLDVMSRGRYLLERLDEGADRRKAMGLDISIRDAYTGRNRASASLSGGESFMAALSLALGLSATVHRRSGGVRLDTLLIDEGFGSLDEESLQDAMAVLSRLREKGQTVGIISHVRELQERIPCQLLVQRGTRGSRLAWADDTVTRDY